MNDSLATLSTEEFEALVERAIDKRMEVWLTQLLDALIGSEEEDDKALQPEFSASLRRSLEQSQAGQVMDLKSFREQLGS